MSGRAVDTDAAPPLPADLRDAEEEPAPFELPSSDDSAGSGEACYGDFELMKRKEKGREKRPFGKKRH